MKEIEKKVFENGFAVVDDIYTEKEINDIIVAINSLETSTSAFRRSKDLFAIRQFLREAPELFDLIFSKKLKDLIQNTFGKNYFVTKSIYFDKPEASNWFVAYHQDLTISVDKRLEVEGYSFWTAKQDQFAVQPPIAVLQDNFTLRIHLDTTGEFNGALKVIPKSHQKGIYRPETINWESETEVCCKVKKGGVMIMKPLLLHASKRTTNSKQRRVIHIEFSRSELSTGLNWWEKLIV